MAARNYDFPQCLQRGAVVIAGSFAPNGSSAVSATSRTGPGWSVARTSAGLFTITFSDKYNNLLAMIATVQHPTAVDLVAQIGVYTAASKTITITTLAAAVATDVTANANARINFCAWFSNTGSIPVRG